MRYRRSDNMSFYKSTESSSSDWAATELNWPEVSFKENLPLTKVFTAARPLVADSPVDKYLKVTRDLSWDQIRDPAGNFSYLSVYGAIWHLQTRAIEDVVVRETPRIASSSHPDSQEAAISLNRIFMKILCAWTMNPEKTKLGVRMKPMTLQMRGKMLWRYPTKKEVKRIRNTVSRLVDQLEHQQAQRIAPAERY
ncbi:hypothetical protein ABVK25_001843 [Lepraria finkii]|uniref:Uncharacterized protein n=1 Tax=Lepraria finkii TaxID=1340010 RepID=A0ABR4BKG1_9LECA